MDIITPARARIALVAITFVGGFGVGAATMNLAQQPEVVTVSELVPAVCADAAQSGFDAFSANDRVEQYEAKAEEMAADITFSTLAADASLIDEALRPIAEHNAKEEEWRGKRDDAEATFRTSADACLANAAAAEAAHDR